MDEIIDTHAGPRHVVAQRGFFPVCPKLCPMTRMRPEFFSPLLAHTILTYPQQRIYGGAAELRQREPGVNPLDQTFDRRQLDGPMCDLGLSRGGATPDAEKQ
jgi:hypothetical protein